MEFNCQEAPEDKKHSLPTSSHWGPLCLCPFVLHLPPEQGLSPITHGCEGQRGSWRKGQRGGREPTTPAATRGWGGGSGGRLPASPSVPASGFLRKNSLFSVSIQAPDWDLWVGEGRTGWRDGGVLASSLSFLPRQPAGPKSPQAPGNRGRDSCQGRGRGKGRVSQALSQEDRGRTEGRGAAWARAQPPPDMPNACPCPLQLFKSHPLDSKLLGLYFTSECTETLRLCSSAPGAPCSAHPHPHSFLPLELQGPH